MKKNKKAIGENKILLVIILSLLVANFIATVVLSVLIGRFINSQFDYEEYEEVRPLTLEEPKVLIDDDSWADLLFEKTKLSFEIPENWEILDSYVEYYENDDFETAFEITFGVDDETSYKSFANMLFNKIKELDEFNIVQSFDEDEGYYEINSFDEAAYNNMYYDGSPNELGEGMRHKVEIEYDEDAEEVVLSIDMY